MENLLDFLLNEMPSHTQDMISALNISIEKINYTRILLNDKSIKSQNQDKLDEAMEYMQANKELQKLENYLKEFVGNAHPNNNSKQSVERISSEPFHNMEEMQIDDDEEMQEETTETKVDYRKYEVDNTIPYALSNNLENTTPHSFSFMGDIYPVSNYLEVWLKLCEILYKKDFRTFENIAANHSISGKKKAYIVYKGDAIAKNNKKSMQFLDTDIVLETNTSTIQKVSIIQKMLSLYKIPQSAIKIYLESDRRPLHNQQPIGKYINHDDDYTNETTALEDTVNKEKPEIKIAQLAYDYFTRYFQDTSKIYDIQNFLNEEWCIENLGIACPLLKLIDPSKELKEQTIYGDKKYPSYAQKPKLLINGKCYIMCMRWFELYRPKLEKWILEHEIIEINPPGKRRDKSNCIYYDFKKDLCESVENPLFNQPCTHAISCKYYIDQEIYIISKEEMRNKVCPHCGLSAENTMQEVTYAKNGNPDLAVTKRLLALRCNYCNRIFINDATFKTYTVNKNIDDINVKFINFTR